jgi:hypothetical protein
MHGGNEKYMCLAEDLVGEPEDVTPLGRLRDRCKDNIKWILEKYSWAVWI